MKIYVGHSSKSNFKEELYAPLRASKLNDLHEIIFPHEFTTLPTNSKEFLKTCDLIVAEVSFPTTGLGIELGWADAFGVPIIAMHKKGTHRSSSVVVLTDDFFEYSTSEELISELTRRLENFNRTIY